MEKYHASCLCGNVNISINADPIRVSNCHCKDCQKWTGCAYEPAVVFKKQDVSITGDIKFYQSLSDQGNTISRGFCPNCGGAVANKNTGFDEIIILYAGTFDSDNTPTPTLEIYFEKQMHNNETLKNTQKYIGYREKLIKAHHE